jgi:hypothetical protein
MDESNLIDSVIRADLRRQKTQEAPSKYADRVALWQLQDAAEVRRSRHIERYNAASTAAPGQRAMTA